MTVEECVKKFADRTRRTTTDRMFKNEAGSTEFKNEASDIIMRNAAGSVVIPNTDASSVKTSVKKSEPKTAREKIFSELMRHPSLPIVCVIRPGTVTVVDGFTRADVASAYVGRVIEIDGDVHTYAPFDSDAMFDVLSNFHPAAYIADLDAATICMMYSHLDWQEAIIFEISRPEDSETDV